MDTLFKKVDDWEDVPSGIYGGRAFLVLQCRGCESIFFAKHSWHSEDFYHSYDPNTGEEDWEPRVVESYWPSIPNHPKASWYGHNLRFSDKILYDLLNGIYKSVNEKMPIFAAIGMRTAFDRISELLEVDRTLSFEEKLAELRCKGKISDLQRDNLSVLIDAGSAAAHRGWHPEQSELISMLGVLEDLIHDHFIRADKIVQAKEKIPLKEKRRKRKS